MIWLSENAGGHRVLPDSRHSEVGGSGAAVAFDAPVEAGEFAFSGFQADLKALDLGEAGPLLGRHAEHRASQASVFMLAGRPVRTSARSQRHLAQLEVLLEFLPFLVGGFAVFFGGP